MRSLLRIRIVVAALATLLATLLGALSVGPGGAAAQEPPSCVSCHERLREEHLRAPVLSWARGVHAEQGLDCTGCHRGNGAEASPRAHDPAAGFVPRPAAAEVDALCGRCHSDPERMGSSELPTDQAAQLRASAHGQALAAGHGEAASCISCHGSHEARSASDPRSSVHPARVAETCGECHAEEERMRRSGLPTDQLRQWRGSVHGRAFEAGGGPSEEHAEGQAGAPTCTGCHDPHAAVRGDHAARSCRGCHRELAEAFDGGPHAAAFSRLGFADCAECHGSHEIRPADPGLLSVGRSGACRGCHSEGQEVFTQIRRMSQRVAAAERALRAHGHDGSEENSALEIRSRMIFAVHALDEGAVESAVEEILALPDPSGAAPGSTPTEGTGGEAGGGTGEVPSATVWAISGGLVLLLLLSMGGLWLRGRSRSRSRGRGGRS